VEHAVCVKKQSNAEPDHSNTRLEVKGRQLGRTPDSLLLKGDTAVLRGGRCVYIASLYSRPSVPGEEPQPTRGDNVAQETEYLKE